MGNDLNGLAQIFAAPFLADDGFINLSRGEIVHLVHPGGDESFVMAQIEIGFRTIVGHENFTVLKRAHGTGIHVDVRVQLDHGNFQAARFQNGGKRCSGDPFTEG